MTFDRVAVVETALDNLLRQASAAPARLAPTDQLQPGSSLTAIQALALFEDQLRQPRARRRRARAEEDGPQLLHHLERGPREQRGPRRAAADRRPVLPALPLGRIHDGARAPSCPGQTPAFDTLLALCASKDDPISHGRHKVWGSRRAVGAAADEHHRVAPAEGRRPRVRVARARRMGSRHGPAARRDRGLLLRRRVGEPCHRAGGVQRRALRGRASACPMPILFVCEDNGIGISVDTPEGWIEEILLAALAAPALLPRGRRARPGLGGGGGRRSDFCRGTRTPAFLHLKHGTPVGPRGQRRGARLPITLHEIEAIEARDPLLRNARTPDRERRGHARASCRDPCATPAQRDRGRSGGGSARPRLETRAEVDGAARARTIRSAFGAAPSLAPGRHRYATTRAFDGHLPEEASAPNARTLAGHINAALADELLRRPRAAPVRRGRRPEGRRLRRHARAAEALRPRARVRHAARRDDDPRARAGQRRTSASCRCRRSSTSRTCTTRSTRCAAKRARSRSSAPDSSATRWSCASPGSRTRRALAVTSTTTTRSARCATSRA